MKAVVKNCPLPVLVVALLNWGAPAALGQVTISDFNPKFGAPSDQIIIEGSGFGIGTITVRFWNNVVASRTVTDYGHITATVPGGATTGPISVQQNSTTPVLSTNNFTVIGSGPYITGFSPTFGSVNDPISIYGVHFTNVTSVKFNGTNASSFGASADGTLITAYVPAGATTGPISVTTPAGTSNSATAFTVLGPGPYIMGFSPWSGSADTAVTIEGVHFTTNNVAAVTAVRFNGTNAPGYFVAADTQIQVNAPAGVSTGPITVVTPRGTNTTSTNFFVPPIITGFSPTNGRVGTTVTINGSNFIGATALMFNDVAASFVVSNNNAIRATVPTNANTGIIRVDAPAGSYLTSSNFTVLPAITGFSPVTGTVGDSVTVSGLNFWGTTAVKFNGTSASFSSVTYNQLAAVVPIGASSGPISITTTNGSDTTTSNFYLPPVITGFTPTNSASGTTIIVTGNNFSNTSAVNFTGAAAAGFTVLSNTAIGATVPNGVITGPLSVTAPAGTTNSAGLFYGQPVITGFLPTHGLPGTNVTIFGTNFLGTKQVLFNGITAATNSISNGQITVTVPNGANTGPISVVAPAGTVVSVDYFTLDYYSDLAVTVSGSASPVTVGSNLVYTIVIANNGPLDAPNVRLTNTLPASVILRSATNTHGTLDTNGNPIIGTYGMMGNGSVVTNILTVAPQSVGLITNRTIVSSDYLDPAPNNNGMDLVSFVTPLPVLAIERYSLNQVAVSWPVTLTNYALQYATVLATNHPWSNVIATHIIANDQRIVIDPVSGVAKFYRLKQ